MLDNAFEALKKYDWGTELSAVAPIDDAVAASHDKPELQQDLEKRLVESLNSEISRDAKEYVCRKLAVVGTAACVPSLAPLLANAESSHMARFALERIPGQESAQALRDALAKASGDVKIGIISSLGARRDSGAVSALADFLKSGEASLARSAAMALGMIGTTESAKALQSALQPSAANPAAIVDALLNCAESLLAGNQRAEATAIYKGFTQDNQPRLVRLAGMRGLLACAGKQA